MVSGITLGNIDLALIALYAFWVFFAGLIWYLRQEDRREGYPLESDVGGRFTRDPWFFVPKAKTFLLPHGAGTVSVPNDKRDTREIAATRSNYPGSPLYPTGDPMVDGVGPAAWAERSDTPDLSADGSPRIVPMRVAEDFYLAEEDPNPVGMSVVGADSQVAGTVTDLWIDRSEYLIRYYQVEIGEGDNAKSVLLPHNFGLMKRGRGGKRQIYVHAITSAQFDRVPGTASTDQITRLEEERVMAYYGGGQLYATPQRQEALL